MSLDTDSSSVSPQTSTIVSSSTVAASNFIISLDTASWRSVVIGTQILWVVISAVVSSLTAVLLIVIAALSSSNLIALPFSLVTATWCSVFDEPHVDIIWPLTLWVVVASVESCKWSSSNAVSVVSVEPTTSGWEFLMSSVWSGSPVSTIICLMRMGSIKLEAGSFIPDGIVSFFKAWFLFVSGVREEISWWKSSVTSMFFSTGVSSRKILSIVFSSITGKCSLPPLCELLMIGARQLVGSVLNIGCIGALKSLMVLVMRVFTSFIAQLLFNSDWIWSLMSVSEHGWNGIASMALVILTRKEAVSSLISSTGGRKGSLFLTVEMLCIESMHLCFFRLDFRVYTLPQTLHLKLFSTFLCSSKWLAIDSRFPITFPQVSQIWLLSTQCTVLMWVFNLSIFANDLLHKSHSNDLDDLFSPVETSWLFSAINWSLIFSLDMVEQLDDDESCSFPLFSPSAHNSFSGSGSAGDW